MKGKKIFLGILIITAIMASSCKKEDADEINFRLKPVDGGESVEIYKYIGLKQVIDIKPQIGGFDVTRIGDEAFMGKELISFTLPETITSIGEKAFYDNFLTSVTISSSVKTIGNSAFAQNPELTEINVAPENPNYTSVNGALLSKNGTTLLLWPSGKGGAVNLSSDVTTIGDNAFNGSGLTEFTIPGGITTIGSNAFANNKLTSITIPDKVTTIGEGAFLDNEITSITIGANVTLGDALLGIVQQTTSFRDESTWEMVTRVVVSDPFVRVYNNGKHAGTYTRPNATSAAWTRRGAAPARAADDYDSYGW